MRRKNKYYKQNRGFLLEGSKEDGLEVNAAKIAHVFMSYHHISGQNHNINKVF
jgi:hypothetical protein